MIDKTLMEKVYVALDIGESEAKLVAGTEVNGKFYLCGTFSCESRGFVDGDVASKSEIKATIINLLEQAKKSYFGITKLILVLPPKNLDLKRKNAKNLVSSVNHIINEKDINILQEAVAGHQLVDDEMVVAIRPIKYFIDARPCAEAPIGIKGNSVGLDAFVITAPKILTKTLVDCIQELEIEILDVIPAPIALAYAVAKEDERKNGVLIADIGGCSNNVSFVYQNQFCGFKEGNKGGNLITEQLMEMLDNDKKQSEIVKKMYGSAVASEVSNLGVYYNKASGETVTESEIVDVVEKSLETIGEEVKTSSLYLMKSLRVPIVIAGGVSNTINIKNKLAKSLETDVNIRRLEIVGGNDAIYYPCIGAIMSYIRGFSKIEVDLINS